MLRYVVLSVTFQIWWNNYWRMLEPIYKICTILWCIIFPYTPLNNTITYCYKKYDPQNLNSHVRVCCTSLSFYLHRYDVIIIEHAWLCCIMFPYISYYSIHIVHKRNPHNINAVTYMLNAWTVDTILVDIYIWELSI